MNVTMIIGNIGSAPEIKQIANGSVCNFSVAVSENYTDKMGQKQQKTEWFNVSAFGKLSEICGKYCTKGKQVFIQGELKTNKWEDKNGNKRESIALIAQKMKLLGSKEEKPRGDEQPLSNASRDPFGDSIPF